MIPLVSRRCTPIPPRPRVQGIGTRERIIRTTEWPAHVAKNRLSLPDEFPLGYRLYAAFARGENPPEQTGGWRPEAGGADASSRAGGLRPSVL